ncbi:MAG: Slp family lipoprotein [Nitrospiraceae bacterium]|nr:Slp family lipoprotein [Nitrospiraceae bacterium]
MNITKRLFSACCLLSFLGGAGCAAPVIPASLEPHIDRSIAFGQVLESPDTYRGRMVVWAGEVLRAKALQSGTELEVLQLPATDEEAPVLQRTESKGRFLAIHNAFLDPATLKDGARVTIVGEVTGATMGKLDEADYRYPTVEVKHLHRWEDRSAAELRGPSPYWGVFGGVGVGGGTRGGGGISIGTGF